MTYFTTLFALVAAVTATQAASLASRQCPGGSASFSIRSPNGTTIYPSTYNPPVVPTGSTLIADWSTNLCATNDYTAVGLALDWQWPASWKVWDTSRFVGPVILALGGKTGRYIAELPLGQDLVPGKKYCEFIWMDPYKPIDDRVVRGGNRSVQPYDRGGY
jgi:hypothetical protein